MSQSREKGDDDNDRDLIHNTLLPAVSAYNSL